MEDNNYWAAVWDLASDKFWEARNDFRRLLLDEDDGRLPEPDDKSALAATADALRQAIHRCAACTRPNTLGEKAEMAADLRDLARKTDSAWLIEQAAFLATGAEAEQVYVAFWKAYEAYGPERAALVGDTDPAAVEALRAAALAARDTKPVTPEQLGEKLRIANTIGVHVMLKKSFPEPGQQALWWVSFARTFHEDLPAWFYLDAVDFNPDEAAERPANIGRADRHFIRRSLQALGPAWTAALAADIHRLKEKAAVEELF